MENRIVLIGFPGSGKSTVGKTLARLLNLHYVDLDTEIENHYRISIPDLMQKFGEDAFRKCEYNLLKSYLQEDGIVLSTGGGAPCYADAMQLINEHGFSVYIKMSEKSLFDRLTNAKKKRPLVQKNTPESLQEYINVILASREPIYNQAKLTVKGESISVKNLALLVTEGLKTTHYLSTKNPI